MERYLLDTNVVSELMREKPVPSVLSVLRRYSLDKIFLPDVVMAEISFGIDQITNTSKREAFRKALDSQIRPVFQGRVLSADEETWLIWKTKEYNGRKRRYTYPQPDLVIAALAEQHQMVVITRDTEPFREAGVEVLNPWIS